MLILTAHAGSDKREAEKAAEDGLVSIHAPTRGATFAVKKTGDIKRFQSTLPRGERLGHVDKRLVVVIVSIHAPTRGATSPVQ